MDEHNEACARAMPSRPSHTTDAQPAFPIMAWNWEPVDDATLRRWLSRVGPGRVSALGRLELAQARAGGAAPEAVVASWRAARRVRSAHPPLAVGDLALDGRDLIRLGLEPGPRFGEILDGLLDWVLDDPTRNTTQRLEGHVAHVVGVLDDDTGG